jgi:N6-L-threonylcarbamoyladenine synthase
VADVLVAKSLAALRRTALDRLVVAGGVGANIRLRSVLDAAASRGKFSVFYPALEFCTDNGAMIALAGCLRLKSAEARRAPSSEFTVKPRWDLASLAPA